MIQEELENRLKEEKLDSIYLLYGEEIYLLETTVKKIKKLFGERVVRNKLYRTRRGKFRKYYSRITNTMLWV